MNKYVAIAVAVPLLIGGLVALTGFGFGGGFCHRHGHGRDPAAAAAFVTDRVDDALDDVDATPEQRTRIHAVKDRLLEAAKGLHASRGGMHEAILAEWKAETPDAARLHALVDAQAEELKALAHQAVDAGVEVHGILTPAQREKLTRKIERWHR